ncbi:MAG: ATP-binding protein [Asticcacaulis sp.]|uniref:ATP-binding protein n=1 Tax=Asticcacaulis sp. TaxID=1872648 RepID=UPI0039E5D141
MTEKSRFRLPVGAQVFILVLVAIVVAQMITIFAVNLAPVKPPPRYNLTELVTAFNGGTVDNARHRGLKRHVRAVLPAELLEYNNPRLAAQLASIMGIPAADVRIHMRGPAVLVEATSGRGQGFRGQPPGSPSPGSGGPERPPMPGQGPPPPGNEGPGGLPPPDKGGNLAPGQPPELTLGEFIAARHTADGQWQVIEPYPETEWIRRVLIWVFGGMLVMAPAAWWFSGQVTRPIRRFADAAEQLGRDPSAPPMQVEGPAELGLAAKAFNRMQNQIQRYVSDRVGMVGAISHDLRTPLTRMRFKLEKAEARLRDSVLDDVVQMEAMISGVIAFVRESSQPSIREPLELTSLLSCAVDDRPEGEAVFNVSDGRPGFYVQGDPVHLRRLFDNLIDNAVKYGGHAQIDVQMEGDDIVTSIGDNGPGLAEGELDLVFQPFYRAHQNAEMKGAGLGLAIARSIARAHGGDVVLARKERGLIARISLPAFSNAR